MTARWQMVVGALLLDLHLELVGGARDLRYDARNARDAAAPQSAEPSPRHSGASRPV